MRFVGDKGSFVKHTFNKERDFEKKLYKALDVPMSRIEADTGFNMGRASEISRDELNFQKFINRLRNKFNLLKTFQILSL